MTWTDSLTATSTRPGMSIPMTPPDPSFELTAAGLTSGEFAHAFFTDDGNDSPTNITTQPGWLDVNGANPVTTITAPAGFVITKVAIKSGKRFLRCPRTR